MKLEILGSLKPINSIIQIVLYDETLIIVGFGNEIRLYNNLLENICPCLIYHEVHHVYGISTEYGNDSNFVAYGIGGVLWAKIISKTSQNGQKDTRMVEINRLLLKDRILACFYIRDQKWLIGCASGNLQLCDISNGCEVITEFFLEECSTLYCMKIISKKNHLDSVTIIGGSAFSKILIWNIDFTYKKQHTQINLSQCLTGHRGIIYCVTVSPCANKIISCSDDREIRIWYRQELIDNKKSNFRNIAILLGHNARIWTVECSWENGYIVSTSEDGDLCIWIIKQMKLDSLCKIKPLEQWYKVHQGRGGRCIAIRDIKYDNKKSCEFITGSEGGDLKIWSLNLNQINLTEIPKQKENNYGYYTIKPYNSDKYWFQGTHFINTKALIAVTRQGEIYYGLRKYNDVSNWNILPIAHVPKYIYSLYGSGTNICMGSSKGGIFFFKFDDITCTITSILYFEHIGWIQNVVYSHIIAVLKDSSYIIIASDSEGNIGLSYIYKNIEYQSKILDTSMLSKYGEIKCVDSVYNSNTIILALGTVLGNFYLLRIKLEDMSVNLLNIQYQCHKGNVSSIKWLNNNNSLRTTGQDGRIIEYIVDIASNQANISIKWVHKWKSPCEYIIDCFQSESYGCFVIGALKHSLMLFSSDEPTSSSFQLILKQNFGGIKRSFYTKFLLQGTSLWFIMVWCYKPSINMLIVDLNKLKYIDSSILSISLQLNSNPISRELYSSCWISSDILALGGEDHYLRIYKINQNSSYSDNNFKICKSIRMLHPLRDIKVFKISDHIYLLIVVGIKQMLNIYKVTYSNYDYRLKTNKSSEINIVQLFSNLDHIICDSDHTKSHCRYICLDILYYWDKEHIISCYIFVGSSKGEIIIFRFKYNFKENYLANLELENDLLKLDFVPLSIRCIWNTKNPIILVGLTNGSLKIFEVSFQDSSINLHYIKDLFLHSSGVNGISIIRYSEDVGVIFASVGHDQCLNIASTNGKIFETLHNNHLSSIRDCCYDQNSRLIYTIGWDQKLLIYRIDKNDSIIKIMDFSISIWDVGKWKLHKYVLKVNLDFSILFL
ncbi:uncharacterized protein CMU_039250 [Cryptosporidium muris RN66]|uniref:Uncharacterized protein n=1 Tax=Cryptosporidium muris (strain RN66) TaxID=441375 RepID=B6A9G7_CRYMR|nr:uncharacterized protein CMU_039250 [Cryptosporidium muris RN66]EEA04858.1 hypothetical protein, conserved [Cryptosporidium muris RN66]|eukprot:XP_002139207.1 hypothetical protein [Cryptosporidium muris RN66]